ncbi:MAG: SpoIIE family protein phosphatase, partial [bacterium]
CFSVTCLKYWRGEKLTVSNMVFRLELGKHTAPGINRPQNEDNIGYYFPQQPEVLLLRGQMFMIADGNGEEGLGEFASKLAIQTVIQEYYEEPWVGTVEEMLTKSLMRANKTIYDANIENRSITHFSTSVTCGVIHQEILYVAHIGTCRAFLLSNANFEILTRSHSFDVKKAAHDIEIKGEENGKVLVRSLGIDEETKVDIIQRKLLINDIILLCTDGIYRAVDEPEIQGIITSTSPQQACELVVKQALANETPDDATAVLVKVKSIKRIEADEKPLPTVVDQSQPAERQIIIKGVRYRSTRQEEKLQPEEKEGMAEFSQDRDVRRPIIRRTATRDRKRHFPVRQILNIITLVVFVAFIILLVIKYGPTYWGSIQSSFQGKIAPDTSSQKSEPELQQDEQKEEIEPGPVLYPDIAEIQDTTEYITEQEPQITEQINLNVVIVDGSLRSNLTWDNFIGEMNRFSDGDRINNVKSSFRLQKSKILWRRSDNPEKEKVLKQRIDQYQRLCAQYFEIKPEIYPLDLTLVIGANFKVPRLQTSYREAQADENVNYYLEILNGFTVPGLAKRLSEQLNYRKINEERLAVVDFRNADRNNYQVSFIKCDPSLNGLAEQLRTMLGQRLSIINSHLFDIKLIVGTDIVL